MQTSQYYWENYSLTSLSSFFKTEAFYHVIECKTALTNQSLKIPISFCNISGSYYLYVQLSWIVSLHNKDSISLDVFFCILYRNVTHFSLYILYFDSSKHLSISSLSILINIFLALLNHKHRHTQIRILRSIIVPFLKIIFGIFLVYSNR